MHLPDRSSFCKKSTETLGGMYDRLSALNPVSLREFPAQQTALILIDLVNGFTSEGLLHSPRIGALTGGAARLAGQCLERGIACVSFGDSHPADSVEFSSYPVHCLAGTREAQQAEELQAFGDRILFFAKNSTNGFLEEAFRHWMAERPKINQFILAGDCTDICVLQLATTLKAWFNLHNRPCRIVVPLDQVDTFDGGLHDADLLGCVALLNMEGNGIELASAITG